MIKGLNIFLRALELEDVDVLYLWENDPKVWSVSSSPMLYSRFVLEEYITSSHKSIYELMQQRFMICLTNSLEPIGTIDLFEFDALNRRAGVGILIYSEHERGKGYAREAIKLLESFTRESYSMSQLYCNIAEDNTPSIKLFSSLGYTQCAHKKNWLLAGGAWKDELMFQKIL